MPPYEHGPQPSMAKRWLQRSSAASASAGGAQPMNALPQVMRELLCSSPAACGAQGHVGYVRVLWGNGMDLSRDMAWPTPRASCYAPCLPQRMQESPVQARHDLSLSTRIFLTGHAR